MSKVVFYDKKIIRLGQSGAVTLNIDKLLSKGFVIGDLVDVTIKKSK